MVNWDPVLQTALSDLEVISSEDVASPLSSGRREKNRRWKRLHCCRYHSTRNNAWRYWVAVHPDDERYSHLVGRMITLPLVGREIPIIADDYVDPEFGTGCVKITPAHDFNDAEMGQRHNLEKINILTIDAAINENAPDKYRGLDRYKARKVIVQDFDDLNLLDSVKEHKLMVPRGDRTGAVIEPLLTDQWYVKADVLAKPAVKSC